MRGLIRLGVVLVLGVVSTGCFPRRLPPGIEGEIRVSRAVMEQSLRTRIGKPYATGGKGPRAYDCSGLVVSVFYEQGIELPRTVSEQFQRGYSIAPSRLRYGDLVFFSTKRHRRGHVGIYTDEGFFIHASASKGVIVSALEEPYYAKRFRGARRVIARLEP